MNEALAKKLNVAAGEAVKSQIGGNKDHGWGNADSTAVIETLIMEAHEEIAAQKAAPIELVNIIASFVNPSAVRQKLEAAKMLNVSEGRKAKATGWMDALKA